MKNYFVALVIISIILFSQCETEQSKGSIEHLKSTAEAIDQDALLNADKDQGNWLTHGKNYEENRYSEQQLESKIIENLQEFLLELGKGFAFIGNQYRITLNNNHFYIDLVFYHRILKCFVLIDLKIGEAKHEHIGQMNMYLNYIKEEENMPDDNEPIGIILVAAKDEIMVKYAKGGLSNKVFVSKYQTYLPDKEILEERLRIIISKKE